MYSPYGTANPTFGRPSPAFAASTSPSAEGTAVEKVKRHPTYYLQGGDIHFLVENYIFRVHRYFFERESAVFREKLAIPAAAGQPAKGSSDANPYPLDDVRANDFSKFLWVFYNPKYSLYDADVDDWSAILKLAYDWRFAEIKKLCCRELEKVPIEPVKKISLYQAYDLDRRLLMPSYSALTMREEPLSVAEGRQLGLETALLIATARECARGKPSASGAHSPTPASIDGESMEAIIKRVFGLSGGPPSPSLSPVIVPGGQFGLVSGNGTPSSPPRSAPNQGGASSSNSAARPNSPTSNGLFSSFGQGGEALKSNGAGSGSNALGLDGTDSKKAPADQGAGASATTTGMFMNP
ncbi:hypothetical protein K474DRAFT_1607332 [Panus rudis PR-1116 ss-1]|nr:hypothetical protein K474DRAFT_1607332 [Panus rudis PR-1116 ss-1]